MHHDLKQSPFNFFKIIETNKLIYYFFIFMLFFNCEDKIDLDLPTTQPRLVIDASINWQKETSGSEQSIKLSLSTNFYNTAIPPANNAIVYMVNSQNEIYNFTEEGNTGLYTTTNFIPQLNETYTLNITYNNETYTATEILKPVSDIEYVEQNLEGGFSGNETEIKAFFTDPADQENYYFFEFAPSINVTPTFDAYKDEFFNGNQIFGFYTEADLSPGDSVTIKSHGVSQQFYQYIYVLLQQTSNEGGGPFETQPATVRGNCINTTNPKNYPLGYFRLSQVSQYNYTIQ